MRLVWATSFLMLTSACRADSSNAGGWRTPRPAWRVEGVEPRTVATGDGAAAFATEHAKGVVAVDLRTGRKLWEIAVPDLVPESLVIAGRAVVMSQQSGVVSSVELADGSRRWSTAVGCSFIAPQVQEDLIIGACDSLTEHPLPHGIAVLDVRTGAVKARVDSPDGFSGTAGIDTRALYMARGTWPSGVVIAVDRASGREVWRRTLPDGPLAARIVNDVLVVQGAEVFGLRRTDGAELWRTHETDRTAYGIQRSVVLHQGLIAHPRDVSLDGLDPATGRVVATWSLPAEAIRRGAPMNGLWQAGDRLVVHMYDVMAPGHLVVWSEGNPQVLETPPGAVTSIADGVLVQRVVSSERPSVRGLLLSGETSGRFTVTRTAPWRGPDECETDDYEVVGTGSLERIRSGIFGTSLVLLGQHLYWQEAYGTVWRVPLEGGAAEPVPEMNRARLAALDGPATGHGRYVAEVTSEGVSRVWRRGDRLDSPPRRSTFTFHRDLLVDGDRVFERVTDASASGYDATSSVAVDASYMYFVARGEPYWDSADSGSLARTPRHGGRAERLLGPVRWPEAVAVLGSRVLVGLARGDILSLPRDGGPVSTVVREKRAIPCGRETVWMRAIGGSLYWLRLHDRYRGGRGILWRLRP